MSTVRCAPQETSRFKGAAIGFGVTLVWIAALAGAQFLLAPHTVAVVGGMDPEIDAWVVTQLRAQLAETYAIIALILSAYWVLSAVFGGSQFLGIKSANVVLVLSGLVFASAIAVTSFVRVPEAFKGACSIFGVSDTFPPPTAGYARFDGLTPCETFLYPVVPSILLGLPVILLVVSAILRIVGSRRQ